MNNRLIKQLSAIALISMIGLSLQANNVDMDKARQTANGFLKQRIAKPGTFNSPALADLKLAHIEASSVDRSANAYYAFNISGGGFVIVAGDDRASQVLGFSDRGQLDFKRMPDNLKALLDDYKAQIEYLQAHPNLKVPQRTSDHSGVIVEPLVKTTWGPQLPYCLQCHMLDGQYSKVGCAGVQMAQIVNYWQYPVTCGPIASYYCSRLGVTLEELPVTTFDYSLMLNSYSHWDSNKKVVVQDTYTNEQAQEAAKLCRYVGQAAKMNYSPSASGTDGKLKLAGMKVLGYNPDAQSVERASGYTDEEWESLMREELDAGHPIMYGATHATADVGHAFIFDGYDSDGYFHINLGWYGFNDGWFLTTAIITTNPGGQYRNYSRNHYMFLDMRPPYYCNINAQGIDASHGFFLLDGSIDIHANDVSIHTSYTTVDLIFTITDNNGNMVAASDTINVAKSEFTQHSDVIGSILLPNSLAEGTYNLQFSYIVDGEMIPVGGAQSELTVAGRLAKFDSAFNMDDLSDLINILITDASSPYRMDDLSDLINHLLSH